MATSESMIPIQLMNDNFSLNSYQAITALNKTIPILFIGMMAELLFAYCLRTSMRHQIENN
jgi:hypothetical protein